MYTHSLERYAADAPEGWAQLAAARRAAFGLLHPGTHWPGWDADDARYTHVCVRPATGGPLVGGARVWVPPSADAAQAISLWEDFLPPPGVLQHLHPVAELGRMWVHPDCAQPGGVLAAVWQGVAQHLAQQQPPVRHLLSILALGPAPDASSLAYWVSALARLTRPNPWGAFCPAGKNLLGLPTAQNPSTVSLPPLARLAVRMGGVLLGAQVQPSNPGVADALVCIPLAQVPPAYRMRFMPGL